MDSVTHGQGQEATGGAGGHGRSWWPQEELVTTGGAGRLLAPLCCTAECSKPGVKYTGGGESFSRAFFKCPVQLYIILKKMLLPSFHLLPPSHPIIGCAALVFFKERVHLTTLFSKEA